MRLLVFVEVCRARVACMMWVVMLWLLMGLFGLAWLRDARVDIMCCVVW